ncbi:MAG: GTPase Era [Wenzhouxiangella sp.]
MTEKKFGHVALIGRPNSGKSTLLNALTGEHVAIVTHKPQTTRQRILGLLSEARGQIALVDTPGLHRGSSHALNRRLNRTAKSAMQDVDAVVLVVDATRWTDEDDLAAEHFKHCRGARLLALNKIDLLPNRARLLELTADLSQRLAVDSVVYLSALKGDGLDDLLRELFARLPVGEPQYPIDEFTDRSSRFLAAELVREQLMLQLHQEVPYGLTVVVERFASEGGRLLIDALILVSEERHKGMVIGRQGSVLKRVGSRARRAMAELFDQSVHLELHVKTRQGWIDDERLLDELGFAE